MRVQGIWRISSAIQGFFGFTKRYKVVIWTRTHCGRGGILSGLLARALSDRGDIFCWFCWNKVSELQGRLLSVSCPVSSDFWSFKP